MWASKISEERMERWTVVGRRLQDRTDGQMDGVTGMRKVRQSAGQPMEDTHLPRVGWPFRHPSRPARALLSRICVLS